MKGGFPLKRKGPGPKLQLSSSGLSSCSLAIIPLGDRCEDKTDFRGAISIALLRLMRLVVYYQDHALAADIEAQELHTQDRDSELVIDWEMHPRRVYADLQTNNRQLLDADIVQSCINIRINLAIGLDKRNLLYRSLQLDYGKFLDADIAQ